MGSSLPSAPGRGACGLRQAAPFSFSSSAGGTPFEGDILVLIEEHDTGGECRLDVIDRCHPDRDGYYSVGAHLWFWHESDPTAIPARDRMRAGLTALAGLARTVLARPSHRPGRALFRTAPQRRRPPVAPQRRARGLPTGPTPHETGPCPLASACPPRARPHRPEMRSLHLITAALEAWISARTSTRQHTYQEERPMTDTPPDNASAHSTLRVLAALAELGEASAAEVAEKAGLGYSTTTPKLRAWEESGQAERVRTPDGRTLWRLADAGRTATATTATADPRPAGIDTPKPTAEPDATDAHSQSDEGSSATSPSGDPPVAGDDHSEPTQTSPGPVVMPDPEASTTIGDDAGDESPVDPVPQKQPDDPEPGETPQAVTGPAKARRAGGSLRGAALDVLEAHPDRQYKVGELCRLVDAANAGTDAAKASAGAVANALAKLVVAGNVVQTVERPATFQLAPTPGQ
ncbi:MULTISPECIES: MarR family winged helix-turn-helix transcriptional regulator [unclassified Micromonospora]|uniref:MarR family winged helix-turn-helix transcriptional regulator n=1 Tax=unclassified Micromonospora TaxID=2617518 RepID=UPI002FEE7906